MNTQQRETLHHHIVKTQSSINAVVSELIKGDSSNKTLYRLQYRAKALADFIGRMGVEK